MYYRLVFHTNKLHYEQAVWLLSTKIMKLNISYIWIVGYNPQKAKKQLKKKKS
jgi:hypothetical protein